MSMWPPVPVPHTHTQPHIHTLHTHTHHAHMNEHTHKHNHAYIPWTHTGTHTHTHRHTEYEPVCNMNLFWQQSKQVALLQPQVSILLQCELTSTQKTLNCLVRWTTNWLAHTLNTEGNITGQLTCCFWIDCPSYTIDNRKKWSTCIRSNYHVRETNCTWCFWINYPSYTIDNRKK